MLGKREVALLQRGKRPDGNPLTAKDREELLQRYLPRPASRPPSRQQTARANRASARQRKKPMRSFVKKQIYFCLYTIVHFIFSVYVRFRQAVHAVVDRILAILYYHHRAPEYIQKDVKPLKRLPQHLSFILDLRDDDHGNTGLEGLVNDVGEIAAWCACAGIAHLSIYERTGILKKYIPQTHASISDNLESYFGPHRKPTLSLRAPNLPSYSPPNTPPSEGEDNQTHSRPDHITILLLSEEDGRSTLVDLTKTLSEMAQRNKISPKDISADLIDAEICEIMGEPDLLILFGPRVDLKGYPPWQVRLTEIFHVRDNQGVSYQVFIRALYKYAKAQMRFGR